MNPLAMQDPIGAGLPSLPDPNAAAAGGDPMAALQAQQQAMMSPISGAKLPQMLDAPSTSEKLLNLGLAMIQADASGLGVGGSIAAGLQAYNNTLRDYKDRQRKERADRLAEYDLLSRIRERQNAEVASARRLSSIEELKRTNPEMADLIELDPEQAAKAIAAKLTPAKPFEGTAIEAQDTNILLTGDPTTAVYAAAYNRQAQPKLSIGADGTTVTVTPNMSAYRQPTYAGATGDPQAAAAAASGENPTKQGPVGGITMGDPQASLVEGFEFVDGARPTAQDAKVVKDLSQAQNTLEPLFAERRKILEKNPNPVVGSADAQLLEQNSNALALVVKNLEQTGALDKGSMDVILGMMGDPIVRGIKDFTSPFSGISESVAKVRGGKDLQDQLLTGAKTALDDKLRSAAQARGYRPKNVPPAAPSSPASADTPADTPAQPAAAPRTPAAGAPTQEQLEYTAQKYGMTVEQVKQRLGIM